MYDTCLSTRLVLGKNLKQVLNTEKKSNQGLGVSKYILANILTGLMKLSL